MVSTELKPEVDCSGLEFDSPRLHHYQRSKNAREEYQETHQEKDIRMG